MEYPVCILVMAHSQEMLLRNLLSRLQHPQVLVYVHIDRKSSALFDSLSSDASIRLVQDRVDVKWAHISQVEAIIHSYREIRAAGNHFFHFLVISGQDTSLLSMDQLVDHLANFKKKSLLGYVAMSKEGWAASMKRFRYHYYVPCGKLLRGMMMVLGLHRRFPLGLRPYAGPQWINVAMEHMDYMVEFYEQHPSLQKFMRTTRFPEEMIFQTLLLNSPYAQEVINEDARFIKWVEGKSNPEILTEHDVDEIKRATNKLFARKIVHDLNL